MAHDVIKNKAGDVVSSNQRTSDFSGKDLPAFTKHCSEVNRDKRLRNLSRRDKDVAWLLAKFDKLTSATENQKPTEPEPAKHSKLKKP